MTVEAMIAKRRARWEEREDIEYDRALTAAAVDRIMEDEALRQEILLRPYLLIELTFLIVDKKKKTVPFFLNEVQADFIRCFEENGSEKPYLILKGRQQGFTSLITAMQLAFSLVRKNFSGFTLADKSSNAIAIFNDKARVVYERLPARLRPTDRFSSKRELFFDRLNSSWRIDTATAQVGRSRTLNFVHFSEAAFYRCSLSELQMGIGEAMTEDCICIYETTANGFNEAKDLWDSHSCVNLFYEWWRTAEYRATDFDFEKGADAWLTARIAFLKERGLDREQIAWYCRKYASFLDKNTVKQEYPCTPEEAFVSSGNCIFDKESIANRILQLGGSCRGRVGYFTYDKIGIPIEGADGDVVDMEWRIENIAFVESRDGYVTLHEEPLQKRDSRGIVLSGAPYVLGGDTAGAGEDYFAAKVICNLDGRTVATLHRQRMDEDLYGEQIFCLGAYYNHALIAIETNYSRHPTRVLQKYEYPNLYLRERLDRQNDTVEAVVGFETTPKTRPIILAELVARMRDDPSIESDIGTLKEMLTFVKLESGRQEAMAGYHDDLVMSLAIAHHIASRQARTWIEIKRESDRFIETNFCGDERETGHQGYMIWEDF